MVFVRTCEAAGVGRRGRRCGEERERRRLLPGRQRATYVRATASAGEPDLSVRVNGLQMQWGRGGTDFRSLRTCSFYADVQQSAVAVCVWLMKSDLGSRTDPMWVPK